VHQVHAREELVRRIDAAEVLARNSHEVRQACTGPQEDRVEREELADRDARPDEVVGEDADSHPPQLVDFCPHDFLREAEPGDPICEDSAGFMERLEEDDRVPEAGQLCRGSQPGRSGTDDGDPLSRRFRPRGQQDPVCPFVICCEPLELPDADRRLPDPEDALALALHFLGADAPADGRKEVALLDNPCCSREVASCDEGDERRYVDLHRAALHA